MFAATPISRLLLLGLILISTTSCSYLCDCKSSNNAEQNTLVGTEESTDVDNRSTAESGTSTSAVSNTGASVAVSNSAPIPPATAPVVGTATLSSNTASSNNPAANPPTTTPVSQSTSQPGGQAQVPTAAANSSQPKQLNCPDPTLKDYKKSVALTVFPRRVPSTGNLGGLQHVEQKLPELLGANLHNHHSMLALSHLPGSLLSADARGELNTATQVQALSKQHRVQFIVSGEVDDMALRFPASVVNPGLYTRFINGTHNLLHINTPLDKRYRAFNFKVDVRDGLTGHIVFSNHYHTFGKWKPAPNVQVGFGSPQFWETDYGDQVRQLIELASDEMAGAINCQPYFARVDAAPGQQQIVIHSGNSNGLHSGDTLDIYQLVYLPITGEYQRSDTRLVKRTGRVQLIETYPSHSIANVIDETLLGGQYVVKAR